MSKKKKQTEDTTDALTNFESRLMSLVQEARGDGLADEQLRKVLKSVRKVLGEGVS